MLRPAILVAASVLALAASGCGVATTKSSATKFKGEQRAVAQTVEDLQSAGRKGDARKICDDLLAASVKNGLKGAGNDCVKVVKRQIDDTDSFELEVKAVTITGGKATARVKSTENGHDRIDTVGLVREGATGATGAAGVWKIATLG